MAKITIEELSESVINTLKADLSNIDNKIKTIQEKLNEININDYETLKYDLVVFLNKQGIDVTIDDDIEVLKSELDNLTVVKSEGNATAADVLSGKTFINESGELITGTIPINDSLEIIPGAENQILQSGYYNNSSVSGDVNLIPYNIKKGVTIFGVEGIVGDPVINIINKTYNVNQGNSYKTETQIGSFSVPYTGTYEFITTYYHAPITNYASHLGFSLYARSINDDNMITAIGTTATGDDNIEKHYCRYTLNAGNSVILTTEANVNGGSYRYQGYGYYIVKVNYIGN